MEPITIRFDEDELAALDSEAEDRGYSSRSEYIRQIVRNRNSTEPNTDLRDRVDELEQRVEQLEESPPTAQSDESDALSDSTGETMETPHRTDETAGSTTEPTPETTDVDGDALEDAYREWVENDGPNTLHGKEMMHDLFNRLRREQILTTSEIREAWFEEWGDAYNDADNPKKSLWDSMKRHVKKAPGVKDAGTGQWKYAGDEAVAEELSEYL